VQSVVKTAHPFKRALVGRLAENLLHPLTAIPEATADFSLQRDEFMSAMDSRPWSRRTVPWEKLLGPAGLFLVSGGFLAQHHLREGGIFLILTGLLTVWEGLPRSEFSFVGSATSAE
jgi:hypothetical protein